MCVCVGWGGVVCVRLRERDRANLQRGVIGGKEKAIPGDTWFFLSITVQKPDSKLLNHPHLSSNHRLWLFPITNLIRSSQQFILCTLAALSEMTPGCHLEYVYLFLFSSAQAMMTQIKPQLFSQDRDAKILLDVFCVVERTLFMLFVCFKFD